MLLWKFNGVLLKFSKIEKLATKNEKGTSLGMFVHMSKNLTSFWPVDVFLRTAAPNSEILKSFDESR